MALMKQLLVILFACAAYRLVINSIRLLKIQRLLKDYNKYLDDQTYNMVQKQDEVVELFKLAGIKDSVVPTLRPLGMGHGVQANISVFQNLTNVTTEIPGVVLKSFHRAIGIYKRRINESMNPLYWTEWLINLPKHVLVHFELPEEDTKAKIVQLVYWVVGGSVTFFYGVYKTEVDAVVRTWIKHHFG